MANLSRCNLTHANLCGTNLERADLSNANLDVRTGPYHILPQNHKKKKIFLDNEDYFIFLFYFILFTDSKVSLL